MKQKTKTFHIYTDGSCRPNPGTGGWGIIGFSIKNKQEYPMFLKNGYELNSTNNKMELKAMIEALKFISLYGKQLKIKKTDNIIFYTDSAYVYNGLTKWIETWKRYKWNQLKNKPLWTIIDFYLTNLKHKYPKSEIKLIKGHNGLIGNEIADQLAYQAITTKI